MKIDDKWSKIFVPDPCQDIEFHSYNCEPGIDRIVISQTPEVQVLSFGEHVNIVPMIFEDAKVFDDLAIEAIIKAHALYGKTFHFFSDAEAYLKEQDVPLCNVLVSRKDVVKTCPTSKGIRMIRKLFNDFERFRDINFIHVFDEIKSGSAYFLPEPEFWGAIPSTILANGDIKYGLVIPYPLQIARIDFV